MKKTICILLLYSFLFSALAAQDLTSKFDESKMRERVKTLSSDAFEGRGPGTPGGTKAAQYIADQLKASGVKPGNKGTYFQDVGLVGLKADPATQLRVNITNGPTTKSFKFADDFVATTGAQTENISVNADVVFAGYGIDAPLYKWND